MVYGDSTLGDVRHAKAQPGYMEVRSTLLEKSSAIHNRDLLRIPP
jgi:hypothetical protein